MLAKKALRFFGQPIIRLLFYFRIRILVIIILVFTLVLTIIFPLFQITKVKRRIRILLPNEFGVQTAILHRVPLCLLLALHPPGTHPNRFEDAVAAELLSYPQATVV